MISLKGKAKLIKGLTRLRACPKFFTRRLPKQMTSSVNTSVAISRTTHSRLAELAQANTTSLRAVVERILTVFLDSQVPGSNELDFPKPTKRGRGSPNYGKVKEAAALDEAAAEASAPAPAPAPMPLSSDDAPDPDEENDPLDIDDDEEDSYSGAYDEDEADDEEADLDEDIGELDEEW